MADLDSVVQSYRSRFGVNPRVLSRAPGRVNLIGEHTDYNEGWVLPFAIARSLHVAAGPGDSPDIVVHSCAIGASVQFDLEVSIPAESHTWQNYVRGVVVGLRRAGVDLPPAKLCIGGDLPSGTGLSSSAALCVAASLALLELSDARMDPLSLARIAQAAEREFASTPCGVMDPLVSLIAREDQAVLIDCRTCAHQYVPVDLPGCTPVLIDSGIKRDLAASAYRERVTECRRVVAMLADGDASIRALRDVSAEALAACETRVDPVLLRRARHVLSENDRVLQAVTALREKRPRDLGLCLRRSHESLRDDYEVSCPQIEEVMAVLARVPGMLGARMIGGGFGGSILAIVRSKAVDHLQPALDREYNRSRSEKATVRKVRPAAGAECRRI